MATVHLALRHRDPKGFKGTFSKLIRLRMVTQFPHAGVLVSDTMYHSTLANGAHAEVLDTSGWLLLPVPVPYELAMARIKSRLGRPYDWVSLFAFLLPWRARWSSADYCYEFAFFVLTGREPTHPISAEHLLVLVAEMHALTYKD